ncbi:hypothetical protein [Desulfatitalea alkaliphila]|uniref:Uncharacterized protein n=1 Tax=Desulfatitalea alkaliphila TaxID=2929485 RepID=A0AA41UJZ6_9BACT|nr:hypothetical protein [Desulfatitalea alkaliphila]MCJ8502500.1 hypothetical protein [Desulfatitalea alkaliphila]
MEVVIKLIQYACALIAAVIVGNWFLKETRKLKAAGAPWYAPYFTPPGMIILTAVVLLPILLVFF